MSDENTIRLALVVADFNSEITHVMLDCAQKHAEAQGAIITHVVHVPGVYDMPLAVKKLLQRNDVDGVTTLGVVISGGSAHDAHVADNNARLCADLSVSFGKPVALGVIGHNVSIQQALERKESYARHSVDALISLVEAYRTLAAKDSNEKNSTNMNYLG